MEVVWLTAEFCNYRFFAAWRFLSTVYAVIVCFCHTPESY